MIEIKFGGLKKTKLLLYDNIDQLPIDRFNKANKFWMLHDNIGSSISDFDTNHFNKIALLAGERQKCIAELNNFRILVYNIQNEVNVEHLSFACLVHSIDGEVQTDTSTSALNDLLKKLSKKGLTQDLLKKKLSKLERESILISKLSSPTSL
jgi:hypothetical protein